MRLVVSPINLPIRAPISFTGVCLLILDRYQAPPWMWWTVSILLGLLWLGFLSSFLNQHPVDILTREKLEVIKKALEQAMEEAKRSPIPPLPPSNHP